MKKALFTFLLLFAATAMNAQTIVKGDMNDDKELTITDAVSVVDVIQCSQTDHRHWGRSLHGGQHTGGGHMEIIWWRVIYPE